MTLGWRIAGSALVAVALSLTLAPGAAAEPKAVPKDQPGLTIVCRAEGKLTGKSPLPSKGDFDRWLFHVEGDGRAPGVLRCKIKTGRPDGLIVRPQQDDTVISLNELRGQPPAAR